MLIKINEGTSKEKIIGESSPGDGVFKKKVKKSYHLFKKFDAWGVDAKYFTDVLLPNDYKIIVIDTEENKKYVVMAKDFQKNGQFFHFKNESNDHRAQIFLSRRFWMVEKNYD